jgi:hypothetical protein
MREVKLVSLFRLFSERSQLGLIRKLETYVEDPYPAVGIAAQHRERDAAIDRVIEMLPQLSDESVLELADRMSLSLEGRSTRHRPGTWARCLEAVGA